MQGPEWPQNEHGRMRLEMLCRGEEAVQLSPRSRLPVSSNFRSLDRGYGKRQSTLVGAWILPRRNTTGRSCTIRQASPWLWFPSHTASPRADGRWAGSRRGRRRRPDFKFEFDFVANIESSCRAEGQALCRLEPVIFLTCMMVRAHLSTPPQNDRWNICPRV